METIIKIILGLGVLVGIKLLFNKFMLWWTFRSIDKQIQLVTEEVSKRHEQSEKERKDYEDAKKEFDEFVNSLESSERWKRKGPRSDSDN